MRLNEANESVVVMPSVTLDRLGAGSGSMTQAIEERFLFLLLLLREPRLRMIYVTSMPIAPLIIEYYLALLPGVIPSHALSRLSLVSVGDGSPRPLSEKVLERPRLLRRNAALIPDPALCHLVPYNTTALERDIALTLGHPHVRSRSQARRAGYEDRLSASLRRGGCATSSGRRGPAHASTTSTRAVVAMRAAATDRAGDREAERRSVRTGQCVGGPRRTAQPW